MAPHFPPRQSGLSPLAGSATLLALLVPLLLTPRAAAEPVRPQRPHTPQESVAWAWRDARVRAARLPLRARYLRYLSAYHAEPGERARLRAAASFILNSLSSERVITRPAIVPGTGGTLLRIWLDDYGIDPAAWDRLAENGSGPARTRQPDPWFHAQAVGSKVPSRIVHAPWVRQDGGVAAILLSRTVRTFAPVLRTDWFIVHASWAPAYYDFLFGVGKGKTIEDFQRLVFADEKLAKKARNQVRGVVTFSGVALHNRALQRTPTIATPLGGWYWQSLDVQSSIGESDFLTDLLGEKFDATEILASRKNGLMATFLANGKGQRLDLAAADVAIDGETSLKDKQIFAGRNCFQCHASGVRPIDDEVRALSRDQVALLVADPRLARRILDLYFATDLSQVIKHDQALYVAAVRSATGLGPAANARRYEAIIAGYLDSPIDLAGAAADAGVTADQLAAVLRRAAQIDPRLTGLLHRPARPARRDQFERAYPQLQALLAAARGK